jgi:hypothetical protein
MADFSFGVSMELMRKTAPFILFRMAVYFGIAAAYVVVTGTGAGIGWAVGIFGTDDFQSSAAMWGGGLGFAATAGVIYFLREYILYMVKAGHIAVMVESLEGRELPAGKGQISYAQAMVKERFVQSSVLFGIDQLVKGVVRAITGLIEGIASLLPIPGLDKIMSIVRAFLRVAVGLIDEVILAQIFRTRSENPWETARDAVVLYGQNARPMLINAAWITVISYALAFVVFLVMLAPAGAIVYLIPGAISAGGLVFAILFAWAAKVALIEPFAIACLLQAYFKVTEGQTPDPEWVGRIDRASAKFGKLAKQAASWAGGSRGAGQVPKDVPA